MSSIFVLSLSPRPLDMSSLGGLAMNFSVLNIFQRLNLEFDLGPYGQYFSHLLHIFECLKIKITCIKLSLSVKNMLTLIIQYKAMLGTAPDVFVLANRTDPDRVLEEASGAEAVPAGVGERTVGDALANGADHVDSEVLGKYGDQGVDVGPGLGLAVQVHLDFKLH